MQDGFDKAFVVSLFTTLRKEYVLVSWKSD